MVDFKGALDCPRCGKEFKDWSAFVYHINKFNHSKTQEKVERNQKLVDAYLSGRYLSISSMARAFRIKQEVAWRILKKKGVLKRVRKSSIVDHGTNPAADPISNPVSESSPESVRLQPAATDAEIAEGMRDVWANQQSGNE